MPPCRLQRADRHLRAVADDNNIRQLAHDRSSTWQIKQAAVKQGMRTLRDDGWTKVIDGLTTVDEVLRITKGDQDLAELDRLLH